MEAVENMLRIHQSVQACASSISQAAAIAAITGPQDCVSQMRDEFKRRRDIIADGLSSMGIDLVMPRGAFYVFPQVGDGDAVAAKLVKAGVITVPGSAFGPGGKKHIRISYASSEDSIRAALKRMRNAL
jgi:aspartate aminotransferase